MYTSYLSPVLGIACEKQDLLGIYVEPIEHGFCFRWASQEIFPKNIEAVLIDQDKSSVFCSFDSGQSAASRKTHRQGIKGNLLSLQLLPQRDCL